MRKSLIVGKNGLIADRLSYLIDGMYSNNLSYEFTTSSIEVNNDSIFLDLENPEKFNYSNNKNIDLLKVNFLVKNKLTSSSKFSKEVIFREMSWPSK